MRHYHRLLLAVAFMWLLAACQPVRREASPTPNATATTAWQATVAAAEVIKIFVPATEEDIQPLQAWLAENGLTERIDIVTELVPGQELDGWLTLKGAQVDPEIVVQRAEELQNREWTTAQIVDDDPANPWTAMLVRRGSDQHAAAVLESIAGIIANAPQETPPLVSLQDVVNPQDVAQYYIDGKGVLQRFTNVTPMPSLTQVPRNMICYFGPMGDIKCHHGPTCIYCSLTTCCLPGRDD